MMEKTREFEIGAVPFGGRRPLVLFAGLCVIESEDHTLRIAGRLREICREVPVPLVFKASYDKANRTSIESYRGPGLKRGLEILARVKKELGLPILIDFHRPEDAGPVSRVAAIIQVPAFLCRQTDMLLAAAETGLPVNVKKGQFLAPEDVRHISAKCEAANNQKVVITERGTSFGYHNLVSDFRALPIIRGFGFPVIFDATHSVQLPGGGEGRSGGRREFVPGLARAAAAVGVDGLFLETHDRPEKSRSDAASVFPLDQLPGLLRQVTTIDRLVKSDE
ncbi:MAG: 3-deoxy-8-phosphooctulonate synthase [Candidatus Erginobacter occultus]|nr:3-deoxy-8-phosphooctulonate synthase [Candidatus Erginobacter occultus]